jgi:penicillin-binding protein 1A
MAPPATPSPSRKPAKGKPAPPRRSFLWRFRRSLFLGALLFVGSIAGAAFVLAQVDVPDPDPLLQSTFVCADDVTQGCGADNAMAKLSGEEDRVSVPLEEMPQVFIDAVLAAEDRQFFSHSGIDPLGIARAVYRDFKGDGVKQGGSTITQQYAKNAFLSSERTITRKLKEAVLAVKIERDLSKKQILGRYLNTVYFGRGAYGAEAASRAYFGTSIRNVNLAQAAYLAGLVRAPETADATTEPDRATFRRDSVLSGMVQTGTITPAERDAAAAVPIGEMVQPRAPRDGVSMVRGADVGATYYVEYVRRMLYDEYGAEVVNGGGLRVYTALDLDLQAEAHRAVWETLDQPDDPSGALVSVDDVGRVVAMVGGRDFDTSEVNLALGAAAGGSGRQPGSSFKPIVLAAALEQGISLNSQFMNEYERTFPDANAGEDWEVTNYARGNETVIDLVEATTVSSNTVYADLMLEVGPGTAVEMARELGVSPELPAVNSLVLGSGEVSVLDMASAYSTFARDGEAIKPIIITKVEQVVDGQVRVLSTNSADGARAISETTAAQVAWTLRQVVLGGTGTGADFGVPVAGKTGTTQDYRDAWFVGFTPELTTAVWMGYPDVDEQGQPRFMRDVRGRDVTGGSFPADIWRTFMQAAVAGEDHGDFPRPTFTGEALNPELTTTTATPTTRPYCDEGEVPSEDDCRATTTTTDAVTTTTTDPDDDQDEGDEDEDGSGSTTTTTTAPRTTTTPPSTTTTTTTAAPTTTTQPGDGVIDD